MSTINIENSFLTENRSVYNFLHQPGQGLYIPLYQREYSWDKDNIEQLTEDISKGIIRITEGSNEKEIRFLGTIITLIETNKNNIYPKDPQAVPARIEVLIDGQQRLSTIAMLGTLLTKQLSEIQKKLKPSNPIHKDVKEICDTWINQKLMHVFSFDLGRGTPNMKPKIIRGSKDFWTRDGDVNKAYVSPLANYLGEFILACYSNRENGTNFPKLPKDVLGKVLYQNAKFIELWLKETVSIAHEQKNDEFPPAWEIIDHISQDSIWDFERQELIDILKTKDFSSSKTDAYILCELVQVLSVCHYLLDRCCFTIIQPTDENWAFDMFQSLNATGTPLTAIETFKPTVVNDPEGPDFKDSENDKSFKKIEELFHDTNSAQQKSKRTNDFLTSFFIAYNGLTVSSHFSYQRKKLIDSYNSYSTFNERSSFIHFLGDYADFYKNVWIEYDMNKQIPIDAIKNNPEANLASMLVLFLRSSNHKMAITPLATAYKDVINGKDHSISNFISTTKIVTSFYALWRSSFSNSGLDAVYREFFRNKNKDWKYETPLNLQELKNHFKLALKNKGITNFETWYQRASNFFNYEESGPAICRLALLASAHDTIIDDIYPGLMKESRGHVAKFLCLEEWNSPSLKTIEHIAPQTNSGEWDNELYKEPLPLVQSIGNLTLLPQDINSSVGNKCWKEKYLYFKCVGETDATKLQEIENLAKSLEIELQQKTVDLLKASKYGKHVEPLIQLNENSGWSPELVRARSLRILEIFWNRISPWLFE